MKHAPEILMYPPQSTFKKEIEKFATSAHLTLAMPSDSKELKSAIAKKDYSVLFLDGESEECVEILDELKELKKKVYSVLLLEKKNSRLIREAVKRGLSDFITSPFSPDKLELIISKAVLVREFGDEILPSIHLGESSKRVIVIEQLPSILKSVSLEEIIRAKFDDVIEKGEEMGGFLPIIIREVEKSLISYTLKKCNGNKLRASKILGITRNTLVRKLKEYGLSKN